jgi:hypothetical protein
VQAHGKVVLFKEDIDEIKIFQLTAKCFSPKKIPPLIDAREPDQASKLDCIETDGEPAVMTISQEFRRQNF